MKKYKNQDPFVITAKFESKCAETGKVIHVGEECVYYPSASRVYTMDSEQATQFRMWQADLANGHDY
jgi:hypothetical protein